VKEANRKVITISLVVSNFRIELGLILRVGYHLH